MVLTAGNTEVEFNNQSVNGDNYVWDFGDGSPIESTFDAVHTFPSEESGEFIITLVAFSGNTCTDTARSTIKVENEVIFYVPNSFTPDEDNFNETFQPVFTSGYDPYDFEMLIFNRWGELIFESHNADIGWDGTYGGKTAPDGTYIWKIEFKETMSDKRHNEEGHLNLLR
jgi:gliding motility-associated-like protein